MAVIAIVGAGMMGSAIGVPIADRGHEVRLVGTPLDEAIVASIQATGVHPKMGLKLPESIQAYGVASLAEALEGVDAVVVGVSSAGIGWAGEALRDVLPVGVPVLMITKGLEWADGAWRIMPDALVHALGPKWAGKLDPVAVAGPCIAGELARRVPTCVVFAGRDRSVARRFVELFATPYYHAWTSPDPVGVEVCAALKNAYALAIAFGIGLNERAGNAAGSVAMHNVESAVFAQSAVEMWRLVAAVGGDPKSAVGLAGVGDLDVTCNGGRTGRFGRWLGLGLTVPEAIEKMEGATLECMEIVRVVGGALDALEARGLLAPGDVPLMRHLVEVLYEGKPVALPLGAFFGGDGALGAPSDAVEA